MKHFFLFLIASLLSFNFYSQVTFEPGYFIDNSGKKVDCIIKNIDWANTPISFNYKLLEDDELLTASISTTKEFSIINKIKFIREVVDIDKSTSDINKLNNDRNPDFVSKKVFLKVLVEGKSRLYSYKKGNLIRFFYRIDNSDIKPLIHKLFLVDGNQISSNNAYQQELWNNLKCADITSNSVKNTPYQENRLVSLFKRYNDCVGGESYSFNEKEKRDLFNLSIRIGLRNNTFRMERPNLDRELDYGSMLSFRVGLEAEFILPFNNNKWSIVAEPIIQSFKSSTETTNIVATNNFSTNEATLDYNSIELPIGIRHYFHINSNFKIFANALYSLNLKNTSKIDFDIIGDLELSKVSFGTVGVGFVLKEKINLEIRHGFKRDNLWNSQRFESDYSHTSLIIGYNIF